MGGIDTSRVFPNMGLTTYKGNTTHINENTTSPTNKIKLRTNSVFMYHPCSNLNKACSRIWQALSASSLEKVRAGLSRIDLVPHVNTNIFS